MLTVSFVLLLGAFFLFLAAAIGMTARIALLPLGLALWVLALLFRGV